MSKSLAVVIIVICLISVGLMAGCEPLQIVNGSGMIVARDFDYSGFTDIEVGSAFEIDIFPSDEYAVSVTANENMFEYIEVKQSGDKLEIGMKPMVGITFGNVTLKAEVSLPELRGLDVSGASEASALGFQSNEDFDLSVSGASSLNLEIEAADVAGDVSGASRVTGSLTASSALFELSGASDMDVLLVADDVRMDISGASDVNGNLESSETKILLSGASKFDMTGNAGNIILEASGASDFGDDSLINVNEAEIELTGASNAQLVISGRLDIDLSGGSNLEYRGDPTLGNIDISGGSDLEHK